MPALTACKIQSERQAIGLPHFDLNRKINPLIPHLMSLHTHQNPHTMLHIYVMELSQGRSQSGRQPRVHFLSRRLVLFRIDAILFISCRGITVLRNQTTTPRESELIHLYPRSDAPFASVCSESARASASCAIVFRLHSFTQ